jgi:hypothetical protein
MVEIITRQAPVKFCPRNILHSFENTAKGIQGISLVGELPIVVVVENVPPKRVEIELRSTGTKTHLDFRMILTRHMSCVGRFETHIFHPVVTYTLPMQCAIMQN